MLVIWTFLNIIGQKVSSDQDVTPVTTVTLAIIAAQSVAAVLTSHVLLRFFVAVGQFFAFLALFQQTLDNLLKYARLDIKYN